EAVNGVTVAVKDEVVAAVEEEPVVAVSGGTELVRPLCYGLSSLIGRQSPVCDTYLSRCRSHAPPKEPVAGGDRLRCLTVSRTSAVDDRGYKYALSLRCSIQRFNASTI